ncbi:hypothetical protein AC739_01335 [Planococcus glaciei]|nr:hypothetical protein AC739_01335 [Planococcus glaciei]
MSIIRFIVHFKSKERHPAGSATKTPVGQRKLKAPQEQSDEETEAEPPESEVASPVGFIHFYLFILCLQSASASSADGFLLL